MLKLKKELCLAILGIPNLTLILLQRNTQVRNILLIALAISFGGYYFSLQLISSRSQNHIQRGLSGLDINKKGTKQGEKPIAEAMGIYTGALYLLCLSIICIVAQYLYPTIDACSTLHLSLKPKDTSLCYSNQSLWDALLRGAFVICSMLLVGYVDDTQDLKWRDKLLLSLLGSIPIVSIYSGGTAISLPKFLHGIIGIHYLQLGPLYYVFILLVAIFSTNTINILAGINGLETGQVVILSAGTLCHNLVQLLGYQGQNTTTQTAHLQSALLMIPLGLTTQALLQFNWFPAQVFVGDTFTYFAGMCFAVASIYGHYCETLLVMFIPQVLNFLISIPQLFKIIPCPKHRLPRYNPQNQLLYYTKNYNLINLTLYVLGPLREEELCYIIMYFQFGCCVLGILLHILLKGVYK